MKSVVTALAIAGLGFSSASVAANLNGKVNFKGKAPKAETFRLDADPICKQAHPKPVPKNDVMVNANGTLANVFVYVKEGYKPDQVPPVDSAPVTLDQVGCVYTPHVLGVRTGQTLKILNSDPTLHNVNATAKVNPRFNVGMATKGGVIERKFTKPEVMLRVKCDVHGWMTAYIGVLDHPWFAVTGNDGSFSLKNLPPGEYTLEAWHEKLGTQTAKVSVTEAGAKSPVEFSFGGQG